MPLSRRNHGPGKSKIDTPYSQSAFTPGPSTADCSVDTPPSEPTVADDIWDGFRYEVPWPGQTYKIIEKESKRAITLSRDGEVGLQKMEEKKDENNRWLCLESNGFFGFVNPQTGGYLGYDRYWNMRASAVNHGNWELFVPRKHPQGGYNLLTPYVSFAVHTMRMMCVAEDGKGLTMRKHGITLWEFVKA